MGYVQHPNIVDIISATIDSQSSVIILFSATSSLHLMHSCHSISLHTINNNIFVWSHAILELLLIQWKLFLFIFVFMLYMSTRHIELFLSHVNSCFFLEKHFDFRFLILDFLNLWFFVWNFKDILFLALPSYTEHSFVTVPSYK